ncbi:restriction endonuclease subunit S [Paenibacillus sp. FSL K6-2524]|uniref:restriction endonuclease subunit S n=1 Tax=Paenibacillus sp. FSL K6-2524 TaxID=2954516 RepID=UPI0030F79EBD
MNSPKVRFKYFTEDWKIIKLNSLMSFNNGINAEKDSYGHGRKFINVLDILNNNFVKYNDIIGSVSVSEKVEKTNKVEYGDLLFLRSSETREDVGKSSVYLDEDESALFGGFVIRGKKQADYHPYFLKLNLESPEVRNQISSKAGGSTRFNISQSILSSIEISIPSQNEQERIAEFISHFDKKIQLQQEKTELLKEQKKGYMQNIFNQKLRFNSNSPEWTYSNLGDISLIEKGNQLNKDSLSKLNDNKNPFPVYNGGVSPSGYTNKFNRQKDNIIISEGGNSCGYVNFINQPFFSGGHSYTINILNETSIDKYYLYSYLKYMQKRIMDLRVGSGLPNIQKTALTKFQVLIPHINEQKRISEFLTVFDKKIKLEMKKLDSLVYQKQAFMQQMFI